MNEKEKNEDIANAEDNKKDSAATLEIGDENAEEKKTSKRQSAIDKKDYRWLRKTNYEQESRKYDTVFVLQHKIHRGKVVELRAKTAVQACRFIHWKPHQVCLVEERHEPLNR